MKWKTVPSGTTETLTSIAVDSERRIWVGGAKGTLLSSEDDGRTFRTHASVIEHGFQRLACAGTTCLVALSGGSIVAADLGAEPFEFQATTCRSRHLFGFCGVADTLYASGRRGAVVRSLDGGLRWKSQKTGCTSFLYSVAGSPSGQVICAGGDGVMARSVDAGVTWQLIALSYRRYVRDVVVLDDGDITVVADSGRVSQLGKTGGPHDIDTGTDADFYAVCATNAGNIVAVGKCIVLRGCGGEWMAEPIPNTHLVDVCATLTGCVIAVGSGGTIVTM